MKLKALLGCLLALAGCGGQGDRNDGSDPDYRPRPAQDGWSISSPQQEGLDPDRFDEVYLRASRLESIYSLLVVRNGLLVAERYFNGVAASDSFPIASVTKCYLSALTGIAIAEGVLPGVHATMADYFPEIDWEHEDPRKSEITIQQMLQMRTGYPWEEMDGYYDQLWPRTGNLIPLLSEFPLMADPGARYGYSNLTSHMLGIIIARAYGDTLLSFANTYLLDPLDVRLTSWYRDRNGYYFGWGDMSFTPRDMARFGLLYLADGAYEGEQIIPASWIEESLTPYSFDIYGREILTSIHHLSYGYNWLSGTSGPHRFSFAWGHGGNLIVVLEDLDMVVVTTADYLPGQFGESAWQRESAILELVGSFIATL